MSTLHRLGTILLFPATVLLAVAFTLFLLSAAVLNSIGITDIGSWYLFSVFGILASIVGMFITYIIFINPPWGR